MLRNINKNTLVYYVLINFNTECNLKICAKAYRNASFRIFQVTLWDGVNS